MRKPRARTLHVTRDGLARSMWFKLRGERRRMYGALGRRLFNTLSWDVTEAKLTFYDKVTRRMNRSNIFVALGLPSGVLVVRYNAVNDAASGGDVETGYVRVCQHFRELVGLTIGTTRYFTVEPINP